MKKSNKGVGLLRGIELLKARSRGDADATRRLEDEVALDVVGQSSFDAGIAARNHAHPDSKELTPMRATEIMAELYESALTRVALVGGRKVPSHGKYELLFGTGTMFRAFWDVRRRVDEIGIPYAFYIDSAVDYWFGRGLKRVPRPTQLVAPNVIAHVVGMWFAPGSGDSGLSID